MQPREQSNRQCNAYMQYQYLVYVLVSVRQLLYQGFTKFQCWRKSRVEPRGGVRREQKASKKTVIS